MPTFDIVSEVDPMEVKNAAQQAQREIATRFDFKGVDANIEIESDQILLSTPDSFRMTALVDIVMGKLAKRGVSLKNIEPGKLDVSPLGHARQALHVKQGIEGALGKTISAFIRGLGFKVTAQIQGQTVRVSGKKKDELQKIIQALKAEDYPVALAFKNFRD